MQKYYFDTSIWLDFFEDRDEPNLPKGKWSTELIEKIIRNDDKIIYSEVVKDELIEQRYNLYEIDDLFQSLKKILIFTEVTKKQFGIAKDIALKRDIPTRDALHALIARDNKAVLVTLDHHFKKILDITKPNKPQDLI